MAVLARDVVALVEELAPLNLAEDWDNTGWQIGDCQSTVSTILVSLDPSPEALIQAKKIGAELLITHHPLIFSPLKHLRLDVPAERLIADFLRHKIDVYCAHTNLDNAPGGTSSVLAEKLRLIDCEVLVPLPDKTFVNAGLGRIGMLPAKIALGDFCAEIRQALQVPTLTVTGRHDRLLQRVAVCGGSGSSLVKKASSAGADVLVTGDVKYHDALDANLLGLALIDAGHAGTENPVVHMLKQYLATKLAGENIKLHGYFAPPVMEVSG